MYAQARKIRQLQNQDNIFFFIRTYNLLGLHSKFTFHVLQKAVLCYIRNPLVGSVLCAHVRQGRETTRMKMSVMLGHVVLLKCVSRELVKLKRR